MLQDVKKTFFLLRHSQLSYFCTKGLDLYYNYEITLFQYEGFIYFPPSKRIK